MRGFVSRHEIDLFQLKNYCRRVITAAGESGQTRRFSTEDISAFLDFVLTPLDLRTSTDYGLVESVMPQNFFDPPSDEIDVVLVDERILVQASLFIVGCEACCQ